MTEHFVICVVVAFVAFMAGLSIGAGVALQKTDDPCVYLDVQSTRHGIPGHRILRCEVEREIKGAEHENHEPS